MTISLMISRALREPRAEHRDTRCALSATARVIATAATVTKTSNVSVVGSLLLPIAGICVAIVFNGGKRKKRDDQGIAEFVFSFLFSFVLLLPVVCYRSLKILNLLYTFYLLKAQQDNQVGVEEESQWKGGRRNGKHTKNTQTVNHNRVVIVQPSLLRGSWLTGASGGCRRGGRMLRFASASRCRSRVCERGSLSVSAVVVPILVLVLVAAGLLVLVGPAVRGIKLCALSSLRRDLLRALREQPRALRELMSAEVAREHVRGGARDHFLGHRAKRAVRRLLVLIKLWAGKESSNIKDKWKQSAGARGENRCIIYMYRQKSQHSVSPYPLPLLVFDTSGSTRGLGVVLDRGEHKEKHDDGHERRDEEHKRIACTVVEDEVVGGPAARDPCEPRKLQNAAQLDHAHDVGAAEMQVPQDEVRLRLRSGKK